jgi:plastocyanin
LTQRINGIGGGHRRKGKMTARDALVLAVVALIALVLIEGMLLVTAAPIGSTFTDTTVRTVIATVPVVSTSTVTSGSTTTVTASGSGATRTVTSTDTSTTTDSVTSTSTSVFTVTQSTIETSTVTSTSTSTTTTTVGGTGPFVIIQPGSSMNKGSSGFSPQTITVVLGVNSTVTWINDDTAHQTVTSSSGAEPFNSGDLAPQQSFTFTFTKTGTFSYVSIYYGWMRGTVVVKP